ncbi:MAG: chalcone isomerase family protein [Proteobacteria bacterium]|nr:chalcone isomerase family protein [Pseudomonadota bacterium]
MFKTAHQFFLIICSATLFILFHGLLIQKPLFAANSEYTKQDIPRSVVLEETGDVLTLRGIALHKLYFKDNYLGAFYSLNPISTPQQAILDKGPKRMWLYFIGTVDNLKEYWEAGIKENNPPDIIEREQINISQFFKMIDSPVQNGDTLVLDYVPNEGTKVIIKGTIKGNIKGDEFFNLVLKVWMGRFPPSEKFRKDLFNLS